MTIPEFQKVIYRYYSEQARHFPWRETEDPYRILLSEIMLQQTQTSRVVEKYQAFLEELPTVQDLAAASQAQVLRLWQGLGYNRRALNLHRAAQEIVSRFGGQVPRTVEELDSLPGIGYATASAIAAFAYQKPTVFIETNIRRVFIHCFFGDQQGISDKELMPLIEQSVDPVNPRHWYYALMDYGAMLAKQVPNPNRRSKHYNIQSKFSGSNRQIRGRVIKVLTEQLEVTFVELVRIIDTPPERLATILQELEKEGFIKKEKEVIHLQ